MDQSAQRVLVVDDEKDSADAVAAVLRMMGHTVCQAYDGPSAVALAAEFRPQLVLLDLEMPELDGFEVAQRLRGLDATRSAKIFALTGHYGQPFREATTEARFDGHLLKPLGADELSKVMVSVRDVSMH